MTNNFDALGGPPEKEAPRYKSGQDIIITGGVMTGGKGKIMSVSHDIKGQVSYSLNIGGAEIVVAEGEIELV